MQEVDTPLRGQQVRIVGGSSGIGLATAHAARAAGAAVTIAGRSAERLTQAAVVLGRDVATVVTDLSDSSLTERLVDEVAMPDHLVITAGGLSGGPLATLDAARLDEAWRERVVGPVALVRALVARRSSQSLLISITLTSALLAMRPAPGTALLTALCAAIEGLTAALAVELVPTRVNAIAPGFTDTPLLDAAARAFVADSRDALIVGATARLPVARAGSAAELAAAALFAMTNGYLTGATLRVDGGARWA